MQTTGFVRRALGDMIGCLTLAALIMAVIPLFPGSDIAIRNWPKVLGFLLVLTILSYHCWIQFEQIGVQWSMAVLISMGFGLVFLPFDFVFGRIFHPDLGFIQSTVSTLPFWLTLFFCPLGTIVMLSGWARSIALGRTYTPGP